MSQEEESSGESDLNVKHRRKHRRSRSRSSSKTHRHAHRRDKKRRTVDKYILGDPIGKGGFGTVYKAVDSDTGQFVAIKQINISRCSKDQIESLMLEITLLAHLRHPSVVAYHGHKQTKHTLYIVMEFVENGSLLDYVKRYGRMSEKLAAMHTDQVLVGLAYLHSEGIIHRDIKGANILIGTNQQVKLADFGVAQRLNTTGGDQGDGDDAGASAQTAAVGGAEHDPAGTPYWMAPEIIDMQPPTTAVDIWSVGATLIELLTGRPPYFHLQPLPALYRIVQDDHPPLPKGISSSCTSFLLDCFQREAELRPNARKLRQHAWIRKHCKARPGQIEAANRRTQSMLPAGGRGGVAALLSADDMLRERTGSEILTRPAATPSAGATRTTPSPHLQLKPVSAPADPGLDDLDDWGSDDNDDDALLALGKQIEAGTAFASPEKPAPTTPEKSKSPLAEISSRQRRPIAHLRQDSWDQSPQKRILAMKDRKFDEILQPSASAGDTGPRRTGLSSGPSLATRDHGQGGRQRSASPTKPVVDDLTLDELFDDLADEPGPSPSVGDAGSASGGLRHRLLAGVSARASAVEDLDATWDEVDDDESSAGALAEDPKEKENREKEEQMLELLGQLTESAPTDQVISVCAELTALFLDYPRMKQKLFVHHGTLPIVDMLDLESPQVVHSILQVLNAVSLDNKTLLETLCLVGVIPTVMQFSQRTLYSVGIRREASIFFHEICHASALTLQMFIACKGFRCLVAFLEHEDDDFPSEKDIMFRSIDAILNVFQENRVSRTPKNDYCRLFSKFRVIFHLQRVMKNTLDWMIEGERGEEGEEEEEEGGEEIIEEIIEEIDDDGRVTKTTTRTMSVSAMSPTKERRRAAAAATATASEDGDAVDDDDIVVIVESEDEVVTQKQQADVALLYLGKIAKLTLLFSSADTTVKGQMSTPDVLQLLLLSIRHTHGETQLKLLKAITNLAWNPDAFQHFETVCAVEDLVSLLGASTEETHINQILSSLYPLCRVHKGRQLRAAQAGVVPHLMRLVRDNNPLWNLAVELLCSFAQAGAEARQALWRSNGVEFFIYMVEHQMEPTKAMQSIRQWLHFDARKVESRLVEAQTMARLVVCFEQMSVSQFDGLLDPLYRIVFASRRVNEALGASNPFLHVLRASLMAEPEWQYIRITQLRLLRTLYRRCEQPKRVVNLMNPVIQEIARKAKADQNVLAAEIAKQLVSAFEVQIKA